MNEQVLPTCLVKESKFNNKQGSMITEEVRSYVVKSTKNWIMVIMLQYFFALEYLRLRVSKNCGRQAIIIVRAYNLNRVEQIIFTSRKIISQQNISSMAELWRVSFDLLRLSLWIEERVKTKGTKKKCEMYLSYRGKT